MTRKKVNRATLKANDFFWFSDFGKRQYIVVKVEEVITYKEYPYGEEDTMSKVGFVYQ